MEAILVQLAALCDAGIHENVKSVGKERKGL